MSELKKQVEALLFSSGRAMSVEDLSSIIGVEKKKIMIALKELKQDYDLRDSSLMILQEEKSWKLNIRENYVSLVTKIIADTELSKTVLETLGIIAWKVPILQSKVINVRGSQAYEHVKELVELGFIRKEREGRSYMLRLTEKFFEYFDVPGEKGIKDALKDIKKPVEDKKLGDLEVVNIERENSEEEVLASLELENIEEKSKIEVPLVDKNFLEDINKQINDIAKRNDELEDDELFKNRLSEESGEKESVQKSGEANESFETKNPDNPEFQKKTRK